MLKFCTHFEERLLQLFHKTMIPFQGRLKITKVPFKNGKSNCQMISRTKVPKSGKVHSTENEFLQGQKLKR
jgi:hypothetical protein